MPYRKSLKLLTTITLILFINVFASLSNLSRPIKAQEILFEDDFSNDLSKWVAVRGDISNWSIKDGKVGGVIQTYDTSIEIVPSQVYWNDNWGNYIFEVDMLPLKGVDRNLTFRFQGLDKWYELHHTIDSHGWYGISLDRVYPNEGKQLVFVKAYDSYFAGENKSLINSTYHFRIIINKTRITAYIKEKDSAEEKLILDYTDHDTPLIKGKIGLKISSGSVNPTEVWFDNIKVTKLDDSTPTPSTTKVILAPGMGASWNTDAILNCKLEDYSGGWNIAPFAEEIYNPIINALQGNNFEVYPYYYDWRKRIPSQVSSINNLISNLGLKGGEKIHFVGHSMGGLVGRAYLEDKGQESKIDRYISAGSPHQGTALAYPAWYGSEIWNSNLVAKIAATLLVKRCSINYKNKLETIRNVIPSFQDLLPTYAFLRNINTRQLKGIDTNTWLLGSNFPQNTNATLATLSGFDFDTLSNIVVKEPSKKDLRNGIWTEGKPAGREFSTEGDSAVLTKSSKINLENVANFEIKQDHGGLIYSPEGINTIINYLKGTSQNGAPANTTRTTPPIQEPESALVIITYPASFISLDTENKPKKDKDSIIAYLNPKSGRYKLGILPFANETSLLVGQFLKNGDYFWKEYKIKGRLPLAKTITFNQGKINEDPIK